MQKSRKIPSRAAAHRRASDPGRHTGARAGGLQLLLPDDPGYGGGDDWMTAIKAASIALAARLRALLGDCGHG